MPKKTLEEMTTIGHHNKNVGLVGERRAVALFTEESLYNEEFNCDVNRDTTNSPCDLRLSISCKDNGLMNVDYRAQVKTVEKLVNGVATFKTCKKGKDISGNKSLVLYTIKDIDFFILHNIETDYTGIIETDKIESNSFSIRFKNLTRAKKSQPYYKCAFDNVKQYIFQNCYSKEKNAKIIIPDHSEYFLGHDTYTDFLIDLNKHNGSIENMAKKKNISVEDIRKALFNFRIYGGC